MKDMQEIVSIIVPVFNAQDYLPRCIESILSQTYANWELFLVDDGSEDESLAICQDYARRDPRIRVLHQENQGQGVARNLALGQSNGAYIAFVDADDSLPARAIERLTQMAGQYQAELVICDRLLFQGRRQYERDAYGQIRIFSGEELLREYLTTHKIESTVTGKLFAGRLFEGLRFPPLYMSEDACLIPRLLAEAQKAVYVPEALYLQTIHAGSTEYREFSRRDLSRLAAQESLQTFLQEAYPQFLPLISWRRVNTLASLMQKLLRRRGYFACRKIYGWLREQLSDSWQIAKTAGGEDAPTKTALLAKRHPYVFFCKHFLLGFYDYGKSLLKIVIFGR